MRPWWGLGDALLGLVFILVFATVGGLLGVVGGIGLGEISIDGNGNIDELQADLETNAFLLLVALSFQQLGQFVWPFIVARWKGFGAGIDFGFRFKWVDLPIGLGAGLGALFASGLVAGGLSWLLDINPDDADNTQFLTENTDSPYFWGLVFLTVVGAPFSEEILFRGLILRAFEKRAGWVVGLVGSSVIFTLVHVQAMPVAELAVLFAAIGLAGTVFGALAIRTGRLGGSIVAHMVFNGIAVGAVILS